ncbi:hypothetical protein [Elioraea sp.]|uniref:hypothetical protein n=1 Tax=Elioraea sp. TaxID=2185103 RepID=UPI0025C55CE4|nr:hypothetical protein [Elioraea sp.]
MAQTDQQGMMAEETDRLRVLVGRILPLHWAACANGTVLRDGPPPADLGSPPVRRLMADPRIRYMTGRDRHARFWLREQAYVLLLTAIALRSSWLNGAPLPVAQKELPGLSGLSERMVRNTLQRAIATGDLVRRKPAPGMRGLLLDLAPGVVAAIEARNAGYLAAVAEAIGRPVPELPPAAKPAFERLRCRMLLASYGPPGTPPDPLFLRRSFAYLVLDALLDGSKHRAAVVAAAAGRTGVTAMTIRNTLARAERTGWIARGKTVAATPMARERVGRMASAMMLRWELALDVMALLVREPGLAARLDAACAAAWPAGSV